MRYLSAIQFILQKMYGLINENYMSLSRQMEFHADAVAASVAGSKHLITSLRRLEFADGCYQTVINYGNSWVAENMKIKNLYKAHEHIMEYVAKEYNIPITDGRAQISAETFNHLPGSRLMIKDQWASHPSTDDREEKLKMLNVEADTLNLPAWIMFRNPEQVQQHMTDTLYEAVKFSATPVELADDIFREKHLTVVSRYKLNPLFNGYWDSKKFSEVNFEKLATLTAVHHPSEILTQEALDFNHQTTSGQVIECFSADLRPAIGNGNIVFFGHIFHDVLMGFVQIFNFHVLSHPTVTIINNRLVEVKKMEQPELFAFIKRLTREIGAPFPKKIYFSPDVNASVFYNSSFWSMFLPVRKNLQIGLGLVNAVSVSELKAVLAHEFGHFSQRSMKLGSYVYNMNQVIYNMLYDNDGYGKALDQWSNLSGYFHFFASLTVGIVKGVQFILQKMYGLINENYMSLSR